jgi:short-subunit dehydrogenase
MKAPRRPLHAVITGASSGIGAALARELHRAGARVTLVARRAALLEGLTRELGEGCQAIVRDVTEGPPAAWIDRVERFAPIDVFVNNAGIQDAGPFATSDEARGARLLGVDLAAPISLAREVLPRMLSRGRGSLVNVSSVAALAPPSGMARYAAAKAGLAAFSEALAAELRGSGVHVLTVYPGPIDNGAPQDTYDLYGRDSVAGRLPIATAAELAVQIRRAIANRETRLIYPRVYAVTWWAAALARFVVSQATPALRPSRST